MQIEPIETNYSKINWTKDVGFYSPYGSNEDQTTYWDIGEEFVICETEEEDLIDATCTMYIQIIYTLTYELIANENVSIY